MEKTISQLALEVGISKNTLRQRIKRHQYVGKDYVIERNDKLVSIHISKADIRKKKIEGKNTILLSQDLCDVISYQEEFNSDVMEQNHLYSDTQKAKKIKSLIEKYLAQSPLPGKRRKFFKNNTESLFSIIENQEKQINRLCSIISDFQTNIRLLKDYPDFKLTESNYDKEFLASIQMDIEKDLDQERIDTLNKWKNGDFSDLEKEFEEINLDFKTKSLPY